MGNPRGVWTVEVLRTCDINVNGVNIFAVELQ